MFTKISFSNKDEIIQIKVSERKKSSQNIRITSLVMKNKANFRLFNINY